MSPATVKPSFLTSSVEETGLSRLLVIFSLLAATALAAVGPAPASASHVWDGPCDAKGYVFCQLDECAHDTLTCAGVDVQDPPCDAKGYLLCLAMQCVRDPVTGCDVAPIQ